MNTEQWKNQIRLFNESFEKTSPKKQWNDNTIENLPRLNKENSIWSTEWIYHGEKEKAIVLVGSSPCLKDDVEKLKALDDNFVIICANSSLKYLLKHDIVPNYVIAVDSDDIDISQHLDIDRDDITLLASSVICKKALDSWKGPIWFVPYYSVSKKLKRKLKKKLGDSVPCGGNSITMALVICTTIWGGHTVIFVANEYCYENKYYADKDSAKQEKIKNCYSAIDIKGRQRWTLPCLYNYAIWTDQVCEGLTPPGYFIDTSFGILGKDTDSIHNMDLIEAIEQVKEAFKVRNELNKLDAKQDILKKIEGDKDDKDKVLVYNVHEQQERILRLRGS